MLHKLLISGAAALMLTACSGAVDDASKIAKDKASSVTGAADTMAGGVTDAASTAANKAKLTAVLAMQDDKAKARYNARNPSETLMFIGIKPGMKVAEALPGGGWFSKILIPYLGDEGHLTGVDYSAAMWSEFSFMTPERIEAKKTWPADWTKNAQEWRAGSAANIDAVTFGARNSTADGTYDAVLFIRALHNVSRFEEKGGYMSQAIADTHAMLKPGGLVGIVQHSAPETNSDDSATGNNGYLKKSNVIAAFEAAGFELAGESDVNANPNDKPSETEGVWRLPPVLSGSKDNPELKAKMEAIGESNRMTLKFKKL